MSIPRSSGKAQSSSSIAVPSAALTASGISSRLQLDRRVGAEHLAAGDAEEQRVADLAGGAGDGDLDGSSRYPLIGWRRRYASPAGGSRRSRRGTPASSGTPGRRRRAAPGPWSSSRSRRSPRIRARASRRTRETSGVSSSRPRAASAAGPGEDRGDRVGRGRLALLVLAVVPGDGAVRGLGLDRLAVGRSSARSSSARASRSPGRPCRTARRRRSSCRPRRSRPPTSAPRRPCRRSAGARR